MPVFHIHQDITYKSSSIVEKNDFINMQAESGDLPKYTRQLKRGIK